MENTVENSLSQSRIYQKSIEIFRLTRRVASYVTNDKDIHAMHVSKIKSDKYADSLVIDSLGLVPKVVETEIQQNPILKLKYAKSLQYIIDRLYSNCVKLENSKIQGKDFVCVLKKELKSLRKMHNLYLNSIL